MRDLKAEVIAIGDEMTSGQRLDTNSRWISQELGDLGVKVAFHSTVSDVLNDCIDVFTIAGNRADIVVMTGGLGPTADDLTRESIGRVTGGELEFHPPTIDHIKAIYARYQREMPEQNKVQAYFPKGSRIIPNPEGTAPGIDLSWQARPNHTTRFFCLPGVPAEMFEMWKQTVAPAIQQMTGDDSLIYHHVMHCFGMGESGVEKMLGNLTERGRDPIVGITASQATISLRVSTRANDQDKCFEKIQPTLAEIQNRLGELVFGANGQSLVEVVLNLLRQKSQSLSIADCGLGGAVGWTLVESVHLEEDCFDRLNVLKGTQASHLNGEDLSSLAEANQTYFESAITLAIGPLKRVDEGQTFDVLLRAGEKSRQETFNYVGHSSYRHLRSVKQVLNMLRLFLNELPDESTT